jgi:hypothetical protein
VEGKRGGGIDKACSLANIGRVKRKEKKSGLHRHGIEVSILHAETPTLATEIVSEIAASAGFSMQVMYFELVCTL